VSAPPATPVAAPPAAVLWDMDGTLVDTEPYWMAAEKALVAEFGGVWTDDDARSVIGFDLRDSAAVLRARGGVDLEPDEIVGRLLDDVIARVRVRVPWRPGARQLLKDLNDRGVPCALVTMSWTRLAEAVIEALDTTAFGAVITGDTVTSGKPHPEPYLRAAAALGVDPLDCVAIEDSPTGAESAGAAGCVVLAVRNHVAIEEALGRVIAPSLVGVTVDDLGMLVTTTPRPAPVAPPLTEPAPTTGPNRRRRTFTVAAVAGLVALGAIAVAVLDDDGGGGPGPAGGEQPRPPEPLALHAWVPFWALDDALPGLESRSNALTQVSPFWYDATSVDEIRINPNTSSNESEQFVDTARAAGIAVVASILDATEPGEMAAILADRGKRADHVDAIVAFAAEGRFAGVDLDYERFAFADARDTWATTSRNWVAFITALAERLHADGRTLTVSVPPIYDAGRTDRSGYWVYDYAAIAPLVDSIRVMAYDYSTASSDPGPIAPLEWVQRIVAGTTAAVDDPSKLVLGVPLYGYNWPTATSGDCPDGATPGVTTVTDRTVDELASNRGATPAYDVETGEWSFTYELEFDDGTTSCTQRRQVNYVDVDGVEQRIQLALQAGFAGASLFALGYDSTALWRTVDDINATLTAGAAEVSAP
jgi:HAD superfamily hydrolase (TIGR01509 family)